MMCYYLNVHFQGQTVNYAKGLLLLKQATETYTCLGTFYYYLFSINIP